jgi:glutamine synthetase
VTNVETQREPIASAIGEGEFILLGFPDMHGSIRGKALTPAAFDAAVREGTVTTDLLLALDPIDTPITDYDRFGINRGAGDIVVRPEPETLRELTWKLGWRVCLATPEWPDGRPCTIASREVLRRVLANVDYETLAAFEYEIRLRDANGEPLSSGLSYSVGETFRFDEFMTRLAPALRGLGIELAAIHTEAGPGLLELNVAARPGLQAADDAAFLKMAVKEVAASMDLSASFLAKTAPGEEGSSGHVHLSFWSNGESAFEEVHLSAVAGLLDHLPAASLLLNPTINSYKRLVPGFFAPVNASWGIENRSCALRVVRSARADRNRIECRRPGADANPYLVLAALVASAADGIRRAAEPPEPIVGDASAQTDVPPLPNSLESALRAFEADTTLRAALGEEFSQYYMVSRAWELKAWQQAVSDWERERYERTV